MLLNIALCLQFILKVRSDSVDYTPCNKAVEPSAYGEDVVDAALTRVEESLSVNTQDFSLMRRIALVESDFGNDQQGAENNPGGIWQVSQQIFDTLKSDVPSSSGAAEMALEIKTVFGFDSFLTDFNFSAPLRSALAARLYIELKAGDDIPNTVEDQAAWWSMYYHTDGEKETFVTKVNEYENAHPFDQKMDMWFMLDGSYDVDDHQWEESVNFTCSMASQCSISQEETQVGFSVYGEESDIEYAFENTTDYDDFQTAAYATEKPEPVSNCGAAFESVVDEQFSEAEKEERWEENDIMKQSVVVITDSKPSDNTSEPLKKMEEKNITSFCIGIGDALKDENSLNLMATSRNIMWFSSFRDLTEPDFQKKIFNNFCGSQIVYREKETDMVCVLICISYINIMTSGESETVKSALRKDVESVFHINCSNCRNYSTSEMLDITTEFETAVENGEQTGIILLLQAYASNRQQSDSNNNATTTTAASEPVPARQEEAPDQALCGSDYKSDVWFLLSGSPATSEENFQHVLNFSSTMASKFNVSSDGVQLGLSVFEKTNEIQYGLDVPTNITAFKNKNDAAKKAPLEKNLGKGLEDILQNAFSPSRGAREGDDVKRSVVVLVSGNSTDNADEAKKLLREKNITVFAIGIGKDANKTLVDSLASEPKKKHALHLASFQNLTSTVSHGILKTVDEAPIRVMKSRSVRFALKAGSRRQFSAKLGENRDLLMNVTSNDPTATLLVYVKVGNTLANSATYDVRVTLEKGGGRVVIEEKKLLENYPELQGQEVNLSIAIVSDKKVDIDVAFENDERTAEQKVLDFLEDLHYECNVTMPESTCIEELETKLKEAEDLDIEEAKLTKFKDLVKRLKQDAVVTELEKLERNCTNTTTARAACVESLEMNLKEAQGLEVLESVLSKFMRLARSLKEQMHIIEVKNLTAECKAAAEVNKGDCYAKLEIKLKEASNMSADTISALKESSDALIEYQKQTDPDYQSGVEDYAWLIVLGAIAALLISTFFLIALYKRKKRKEQVEPLEGGSEDSEIENIRENIIKLTEEATKPEASYVCMENLKVLLNGVDQSYMTPEEFEASRVALESLEIRISQVRSYLKESTESAIMPNATSLDIEGLQEQIALAESLQFPPDELQEAQDALQRKSSKAHAMPSRTSAQSPRSAARSPRSPSPNSLRQNDSLLPQSPNKHERSVLSGSHKEDRKSGSNRSAGSAKTPTSAHSTNTAKSIGENKSVTIQSAKSAKSGASARSTATAKHVEIEDNKSVSVRSAKSAKSAKSGASAGSTGSKKTIEDNKSLSVRSAKSAKSGVSARSTASTVKNASDGENHEKTSQGRTSPNLNSGKASKAGSASPRSRSPVSPTAHGASGKASKAGSASPRSRSTVSPSAHGGSGKASKAGSASPRSRSPVSPTPHDAP